MASVQDDSAPMQFDLSRRNKLYSKIDENLYEKQVKRLRALLITDHHIAKGKIQKKTPHEIFTMLESDNKIGEGNLTLLIQLLRALKEGRLAEEAEDLQMDEREEKGKKRKKNASECDDSTAGQYFRTVKNTRRRPGIKDLETSDNENMETGEFESGTTFLHSNFGFKVETLKSKDGRKTTQGSSIPLILPNGMKYNASTRRVQKVRRGRKSLNVVPEALALLEGIEEPVSVLAICGPCRTGKSYILSRLLGTADAFELGHSMNPKTFGIWMGTKVLRGKDFTIVLLDTEGIDAVGASAGQDASILVMTILLSSQLIYNSLNVPHKADLEKMECFIKLSEGITVKQGQDSDVDEFREIFPDFLWLLRDVALKMEDERGREMDPTDFLKTKVLSRSKAFKESTSDMVGRAILTFFPSVECTTLERPSGDTEVMKNIAQHTDKLNLGFDKGVDELMKRLLEKSRAKRGYDKGSTVNGEALSIMAKQYVDAVNDPNSIPAMDNTWQNTIELMRDRAVEEAVQAYNREMQAQIAEARMTENGDVPLEEDETLQGNEATEDEINMPQQPTLMDLHNATLKEVTGMFLQKVGHFGLSSEKQAGTDGSKAVVDQMQKRLVKREERSVDRAAKDGTDRKGEELVVTGGELLKYIQQNREHSKSFCQKLIERLLDPIRKQVESPLQDFDVQELTRELTDALQQYKKQAHGPEKWVVLQKLEAEIEKMGYQRELLQEQQRAHDAELRNEAMERVIQKLREQVQKLQTEQESLREKIQQYEKHVEKLKHDMEKRNKADLKKIEDLQNAKMEAEATIVKEHLERAKAETREKIKRMKREQAALEEKLEKLEKKSLLSIFTKDDGSMRCTIM